MTEIPSLADQSWLRDPALQRLLTALQEGGGEARVAGGAVRNALLGEPVADVDIATTLAPEAVIAAGKRAGFGIHPTGLKHGTVMLTVNKKPFEVTTLRVDVETDGRWAKVRFTDDWEADARRRDFTMNALFCDRTGKVIDLVSGYPDILRKRVRFVGDAEARIREDYLRILRFFRFHAKYGTGSPEESGLTACIRLKAGLQALSSERIRQEMFRLLVATGAVVTLQIMAGNSILGAATAPFGSAEAQLGRIPLVERMMVIDQANGLDPDPLLRLHLLADDGRKLADRMRLTNEERSRLDNIAAGRPPVPGLREAERRVVLHQIGERTWRDRVRLAWAQSDADADDRQWRELLLFPDRWRPPIFPLTGKDLVSAGLRPGPGLGAALQRLEDWWIAGGFSAGKDELIARLASEGDRDG